MKFISWNVNGIRACVQKGFLDFSRKQMRIFFVYKKVKCRKGSLSWSWKGIISSGTMQSEKGTRGQQFYKTRAAFSCYGIGMEEHDKEGRVITLEFEEFYFVTVYTPNSQNELARLDYRMQWETEFLKYLRSWKRKSR